MYLLTASSSVQTVSGTNDFQTLIKHTVSALEVDSILTIPLNLQANTITPVPLPSLDRVQLVAIRGTNPVEVSYAQSNNVDVFTGLASQFQLYVRQEGVVISQLKVRSTVAGKIEVVVAGRFS